LNFLSLISYPYEQVCEHIGRIINEDIKKYGETRFEKHNEFIKWKSVPEDHIDRGVENSLGVTVEQAKVDINNDGINDRIVRTGWSMFGLFVDRLNIFSINSKEKVVIQELDNIDQQVIVFNSGSYWQERNTKMHGKMNFDWYFNGIASIDLIKKNSETYLVAENYAAQSDVPAKIYVFQLDQNYQPNDVCMFVKICPCSGCRGLRGIQPAKMNPAKKWCEKVN
jgi:hypothetical protein